MFSLDVISFPRYYVPPRQLPSTPHGTTSPTFSPLESGGNDYDAELAGAIKNFLSRPGGASLGMSPGDKSSRKRILEEQDSGEHPQFGGWFVIWREEDVMNVRM